MHTYLCKGYTYVYTDIYGKGYIRKGFYTGVEEGSVFVDRFSVYMYTHVYVCNEYIYTRIHMQADMHA